MSSIFTCVLAVVAFLAPHLEDKTFKEITWRQYTRIIVRESRRHHIDPLLVTAIIHTETARSWRASVRSPTHDFGLMQVHVSKNSHPHLLGFEEVLFDPATNVRYGVQTLAMWKKYHVQNCDDSKHPFWSHYQWGYRVRSLAWTEKVSDLYNDLINRFGRHIRPLSSI